MTKLSGKKPRLLLINPPIYDFAAYDFWLHPYGLLRVGGMLRGRGDCALFDFLERGLQGTKPDQWGRGAFRAEPAEKPAVFRGIPRRYKRFGLARSTFREFLGSRRTFDFALVACCMTYWYPGVREVIEDLRELSPQTKIVLGGVYPSLCPQHAATLGADLTISGPVDGRLWDFLGLPGHVHEPALWELCHNPVSGAVKLADGCPFRCSYCSVPQHYPSFAPREQKTVLAELSCLVRRGVHNIAFYDDALLVNSERILFPFLEKARAIAAGVRFHTPNALHVRYVTGDTAHAMIAAGFQKIFLGIESGKDSWHLETGGKAHSDDTARAVEALVRAGARRSDLTGYIIIGHPRGSTEEAEDSIRMVHSLGIRVMLAEFSPLPGTEDGELCRRWVDLDEPLWHNNTVYPGVVWGEDQVQRLKLLARTVD